MAPVLLSIRDLAHMLGSATSPGAPNGSEEAARFFFGPQGRCCVRNYLEPQGAVDITPQVKQSA